MASNYLTSSRPQSPSNGSLALFVQASPPPAAAAAAGGSPGGGVLSPVFRMAGDRSQYIDRESIGNQFAGEPCVITVERDRRMAAQQTSTAATTRAAAAAPAATRCQRPCVLFWRVGDPFRSTAVILVWRAIALK